MKIQEVIEQMKSENLLDDREMLVYATRQGTIGEVLSGEIHVVVLSVHNDTLYMHRATLNNSYKELIRQYRLSDIKIIKSKAGFFGGDFIFEYEGKQEQYILPSRSERFAEFFANK